jgi:Ca-activated chloride channel family protein
LPLRTLVLLSAAAPFMPAPAQDQPADTSSETLSRRLAAPKKTAPTFKLRVHRVLVPVTVTNDDGRKVEGLRKEDFRIYQDGVQQTISEVFVDESPVAVGIVLDASNSMRDRIDASRKALGTFLRLSLPNDEFSLITVRDRPELVHFFTTNVDEIEHELSTVPTMGWTALYDGMYLGIHHAMKAGADNRVLLVLSDGGDNNSRYTESEIRNLVRESDVRIYSITIAGRSPSIEKLALASGGSAVQVHKLDELPAVVSSLSALIHGEYVIGFSPEASTPDGKYHVTKVEVVQPPDGKRYHASWRHGYFAPPQ